MNTLYAKNFLKNSKTGGLQEAINSASGLTEIIADQPISATQPVKVNKPNVVISLEQTVSFKGGTSVGFELLSPCCILQGPGTIADTFLSGIMVVTGADHCRVRGVTITDYNTQDAATPNGHAAIFVYGTPAPISDFGAEDFTTTNGYGNGARLAGVTSSFVRRGNISGTKGTSAEGITAEGENIWIEDNRLDRILVTGILIFNGNAGMYRNILINGNIISNVSQAPGGSHPGVGINPQAGKICGLIVSGNIVYDDQTKSTTGEFMLITDLDSTGKIHLGGTIENSQVLGNSQWGCLNTTALAFNLGSMAQLVNFSAAQAG